MSARYSNTGQAKKPGREDGGADKQREKEMEDDDDEEGRGLPPARAFGALTTVIGQHSS